MQYKMRIRKSRCVVEVGSTDDGRHRRHEDTRHGGRTALPIWSSFASSSDAPELTPVLETPEPGEPAGGRVWLLVLPLCLHPAPPTRMISPLRCRPHCD